MAVKQLAYEQDARASLQIGVQKLSRAVKATLGPRGRTAVIDKGWGGPTVTKDGVTVAEEVELTDKYENMGVQLVKEAASKTSKDAGDGTTTATVLAEAIFTTGPKSLFLIFFRRQAMEAAPPLTVNLAPSRTSLARLCQAGSALIGWSQPDSVLTYSITMT